MPRRVDHEQRRREIADALLRAARRNGLHAVGFREVAAEAGVSVRLVQYYFGSKEALILGGLHRVGELVGARLTERLAGLSDDAGPRARICAMLTELLPSDSLTRDLYAVHAEYAALALTDPALAQQPHATGSQNLPAEIVRLVTVGQQAGEIEPRREATTVAAGLLAMTTGLAAVMTAGLQSPASATAILTDRLDALAPAART